MKDRIPIAMALVLGLLAIVLNGLLALSLSEEATKHSLLVSYVLGLERPADRGQVLSTALRSLNPVVLKGIAGASLGWLLVPFAVGALLLWRQSPALASPLAASSLVALPALGGLAAFPGVMRAGFRLLAAVGLSSPSLVAISVGESLSLPLGNLCTSASVWPILRQPLALGLRGG